METNDTQTYLPSEMAAAIRAIPGGGSGTSDYNDLTNKPTINGVTLEGAKTGQELGLQDELTIDTALSTTSTNPVQNKAVANALGTYVRPNLLVNWYFGNPVNQRGLTRYTGGPNGYSVDRWYRMASATISVVPDSAVIRIIIPEGLSANAARVYQHVENFEALRGQNVTFSLYLTGWSGEGKLRCRIGATVNGTFTSLGSLDVNASGVFSLNVTVPASIEALRVEMNNADGGAFTAAVRAVKLELGGTQSLAHQENGVWVLNEIPDYGEQLAKCQRYQMRYHKNFSVVASGVAVTASRAFLMLNAPSSINESTTPGISFENMFLTGVKNGANSIEVTSISSVYSVCNTIFFTADCSEGGLTAGQGVMLQCRNNGYFMWDANL